MLAQRIEIAGILALVTLATGCEQIAEAFDPRVKCEGSLEITAPSEEPQAIDDLQMDLGTGAEVELAGRGYCLDDLTSGYISVRVDDGYRGESRAVQLTVPRDDFPARAQTLISIEGQTGAGGPELWSGVCDAVVDVERPDVPEPTGALRTEEVTLTILGCDVFSPDLDALAAPSSDPPPPARHALLNWSSTFTGCSVLDE